MSTSARSLLCHQRQPQPGSDEETLTTHSVSSLLAAPPRIINIGLPEFAAELTAAGIAVLQLDWAPPVIADPRIRALLAKLSS
jgi:hypothetical protein